MSLHVSILGPSTPCFAFLHLSLLKRAESQRRSKNEHSKQLRNANPLRSLEDFQVESFPANLRFSGYPMVLTMDCRLLGFKRFRGYDMMCKSIRWYYSLIPWESPVHSGSYSTQRTTPLLARIGCNWSWEADFTKNVNSPATLLCIWQGLNHLLSMWGIQFRELLLEIFRPWIMGHIRKLGMTSCLRNGQRSEIYTSITPLYSQNIRHLVYVCILYVYICYIHAYQFWSLIHIHASQFHHKYSIWDSFAPSEACLGRPRCP